MLDDYRVSADVAHRVDADALRETSAALLERAGLDADDARLAADVLVAADLRGVETHGVSNKLRQYVADLQRGHLNPHPRWRVVRETPSCATLDADAGIGIVIAPKAMGVAIEKAERTGAGLVSVANGRHLGMAAYHAMLALAHDMIGTCMTSCGPRVAPTFAAGVGIGTNPIAVAAPAGSEPAFVFDAATSAIPYNRVRLARRLGVPLEAGWVTVDGTPIMERAPVPDAPVLLPLGATREMGSHKGYGLGAVVDVLGAILNGSPAGPLAVRGKNNHFLAAYAISAFIDVGEFKTGMDAYLRALRALPPAPGHDRVLYAGLPEHEEAGRRAHDGIPLHPEVVEWFRTACRDLGVEFRL